MKELDKTTFWKIRDMNKKQLIIEITKIANKKGEQIKVMCGVIYPSKDFSIEKNYKHLLFWNYTERINYEPNEYMLLIKLKKHDLEEIYAEMLGYETQNKRGNPMFYKHYNYEEMLND